jgi:crotonobetainyl-CoA:carnitine CoA-transferase CaiB-like acyl-CoA transferase
MSDRPLSQLRVLDLTRMFPGAYCTAMLADLGADVLRVEPPDGSDPVRSMRGGPAAYDRGKRSLTLSLKHPRAPEVVRRLIAGVDVVIDSGLPAALREGGIRYEAIAREQTALVWCSITGFGRGSPYAARSGHDISFLGYSGLLSLMAGDTVPPTPDFVLSAPFAALVATVGILAAIAERERTGRGRLVDASLADSAMWIIGEAIARVAAGGPPGWGPSASRRAYRAGDGRLVTLAAAEPRTWAALCAGIDRPDLAPLLYSHPGGQEGLAAELEAIFATRPAAEWVERLGDTAAAVGPVLGVEELFSDAHVVARGSVIELPGGDDGKPLRALRTPVRYVEPDGTPVPFRPARPPALGEHTDAALAAAGYASDEIATLRRAGAI